MIVVKVELWPRGDEARAHEIDRLRVYNVGGHLLGPGGVRCDYRYHFDGGLPAGDVQHIRERGAWQLIRKVLNDVYRN